MQDSLLSTTNKIITFVNNVLLPLKISVATVTTSLLMTYIQALGGEMAHIKWSHLKKDLTDLLIKELKG